MQSKNCPALSCFARNLLKFSWTWSISTIIVLMIIANYKVLWMGKGLSSPRKKVKRKTWNEKDSPYDTHELNLILRIHVLLLLSPYQKIHSPSLI